MLKKTIYIVMFVSSLLLAGCSRKEIMPEKTENDSAVMKIFTSILPEKYFVEKIGGNKVSVNVLVLPGKSPATYEPTPSQVIELSSSDIFFSIGVPFEKGFLDSVKDSLDGILIKDVSDGVAKRKIIKHFHEDDQPADSEDNHHEEDNGREDEHSHEAANDPHIWLSLQAAKIMAENIYHALSETDPENSSFYKANYSAFLIEIDEAAAELKELLKPYEGKRFFVFHPSFGYFADEYGLEQIAVESGGKEPSPASLERIIKEAKADGIKIIIAQPEFSKKSAEVIADAISGEVLLLNPLDPDYFSTLRKIGEGLKNAFDR